MLNEHSFDEIDLAVQRRGDHLQLTSLKLNAQGIELGARGDVYLSQDSPNTAKLQVNLNSDQLNSWHPDLDGDIALDADLDASFKGAQLFTLNAAIESLQGKLQGHRVAGSGKVELAGESWSLRELELRAGDNTLSASGSLDGQLIHSQASIAASDLSQLWPGIAGSVKGELSVQGSFDKPVLQTQLALREIRAFDAEVESLDLEAELSAEQEIELELSALGAQFNEQDIESLRLGLQGNKEAHRWEASIRHEAVNVDASASGQYKDSRYGLLLKSLDAIPEGLPAWALTSAGEVVIESSGFSASDLCLEGTGSQRLCVEAASWAAEAWDIQANVEQLPVRPLLQFVPLEIEGTGSMSALVSLRSAEAGPQGQFELSLKDAAIWDASRNEDSADKLPIGFEAKGEILGDELVSNAQLKTGSLGSAVADFRLGSISSADGAIALDLELEFPDLRFIDTLLPNTKLHSGSITGQASLSGLRSRPVGSGSLRLQDASLSLLALGTDWTEVSLSLSPQSPMRWTVDGGFVSGEGRLSIDGQLDLDRDNDQWLQLKVTGEEAKLVQLPDMSLSASPDLNLSMGRAEASLKGQLRIPAGRIAIEELPEGAVESSSDTVIHLDETSRVSENYPLRLNLQLVLGPKLQIDAFGLDSGLKGSLRIDGDVGGQLQAFGDLELQSGRFEAYGQDLDISRGRLSFRGPLENPQLDFRAHRQVKIGEVGIEMRGTVNAPESSLYSTPAMPESEILSWLLTGRGLNESSPENGERLSNAAVALGLSRAGAIVAELGGQLGLDRFEIADDGNGERLLAGKWVSEALYLQYAYGIFDKLGSVLLRYRLSRRFTLESTSGAEQSLDLIYEVGRGN
ncbi:MAG: translocation/assembly module TamB domain-containing protein [Pseudomonadota bacterium]